MLEEIVCARRRIRRLPKRACAKLGHPDVGKLGPSIDGVRIRRTVRIEAYVPG